MQACLGCVGIAYSLSPAFQHVQMQKVKVEQAGWCSQASNIGYQLLHSLLHTTNEKITHFGSVSQIETKMFQNLHQCKQKTKVEVHWGSLCAQPPD